MVASTFKSYLTAKRDFYYALDEFLDQGPTVASPHILSEVIGSNGALLARPHDLVFREEGARLIGPEGTTPSW